MSKVTHVIVELNMPTDTKWFRPDIDDEYWGEGKPLIMCEDCKHRPRRSNVDDEHEGLNLEFPDEICPCQCEDPWYNWMPRDDWYCGNGGRKEE